MNIKPEAETLVILCTCHGLMVCEKKLLRGTRNMFRVPQTEILMHSVEIPPVLRNGKHSEFSYEPFR